MIYNFEPVVAGGRNLTSVSQIGYIDLRVAYSSGVVAADLEGSLADVNGIDEPATIVGRPDDVFAALRSKEVVNDIANASRDNSSKSVEKSATPSPSGESSN